VIDSSGVLIDHDSAWAAFARANGAPLLADARGAVNLFAILKGRRVHDFYTTLIRELASGTRTTWEAPCRFDGPDTRRFGRLRLERTDEGRVSATAVVDREEARPPVLLLGGPAAIAPGPPLPVLPMCSFCKDAKVPRFGQVWAPVEEYLEQEGSPAVRLSHGLCPRCYVELVRPVVGRHEGR
jgi:hypothetical protein